ncbi:MAG: SPFH domain-containing protein [Candidatus Eremiobacteraeota bacterium]|nr:SPFH domain-containing protein [Candidatus Eremiobacteraeota bacterium]
MGGSVSPLLILALFAIVIVIYVEFSMMARLFHKVGPNEALIVSGGGGIKIVTGGGIMVWPFIQKLDRLSLEAMKVDIAAPESLTLDGVPVTLHAASLVKIPSDGAMIKKAAERFLLKKPEEIIAMVKEHLEDLVMSLVAKTTFQDLQKERDKFSAEVTKSSLESLSRMGLVIESFSVREVKATGRREAADHSPAAAMDRAEAGTLEEINVSVAIARREAETAALEAKTEIAKLKAEVEMEAQIFARELEKMKAEAAFASGQFNDALEKMKDPLKASWPSENLFDK